MSKPSAHGRSKSADIRRNLFRSISRAASSSSSSAAAAAAASNSASAPTTSAPLEAAEDLVSAEITVRRKDGGTDIEIPLSPAQHGQLMQELERESDVHMRRAAAELVRRNPAELERRLPELLRMHVLSLEQDNWMFEPDDLG